MLICDTHADTLWRMAFPEETAGAPMDVTHAYLTANPDDVRIQALALFICTGGMALTPNAAERELAAFEQLKQQGWRQITRIEDAVQGEANVFLTIEGCEAFGGDPAQVERFAKLGVRAAALTWNNENGLCQPARTGNERGLTPLGREMVAEMRRLHIAVDVSHLNERGFWDLLESGGVPPMASHSCAYALCQHHRNLTDDQLRALFAAKGYVGVNFYPCFLNNEARADLDTVVDHMAHMCELGGEAFVGLGSDFDGIEVAPEGLKNAGDLPKLLDRMVQRGFGLPLVEAVAGRNFAAYLNRI